MDPLKTSPSRVDDDLIRAIQSGGAIADKAMMAMYGAYHKDIRALIYMLITRYGNRLDDPGDMVHDSFIVMLHKIRYEAPEITSIKAYWMGIARHLWLNQIKKSSKVSLVEEPVADYELLDDSPEKLLIEEERYLRIERCLCKCGPRCHEILTLWLSDYSMDEIAEKLKLSSAAMARKLKHECFKKLKDLIVNSNIFTH